MHGSPPTAGWGVGHSLELGFEDLALLNAKPAGTRLGFAAQLMMYRATGRFGRAASEFPDAAIAYLAEQTGALTADLAAYDCFGSICWERIDRGGNRTNIEVGLGIGGSCDGA
jgi:hypothetical protein